MKAGLRSLTIFLLMVNEQFRSGDGFVIPMNLPIASYGGDNLSQQSTIDSQGGESFWIFWFPDKFYLVQNGVENYGRFADRQMRRIEKSASALRQNRNGRSPTDVGKSEIQKRSADTSTADTLSSSRYPRKTMNESQKQRRSLQMDDYDFWKNDAETRQAKPADVKMSARSVGKTAGGGSRIEANPDESLTRIARQGLEFAGGFRVPSFNDFFQF
ncbi:Hypothetical protein NTJ_14443 [Nesidiocoris tenuis]|uniref:Uncharacterized protein n=1 Tax=Nesidiocoris tenuis TaxID=355587 RepID=A0ABN7BEM4_9HEMI|nr:Hypothetical protein NTJ_14443 [Nesidiocoris tenuis]